MGIYIRGVEMPKNCFLCQLSYLRENRLFCYQTKDEVIRAKIADNCPLIEVPPHGRLIDADALGIRDAEKQAYEAYLKEKGEFYVEEPLLEYMRGRLEGLTDASGRVRFAPTIIPAEEGET